MNKIQPEGKDARQWQELTLSQYVELRNGVPLGDGKSMQNMLSRSFGAASFASFWKYWNPIWGYGLGKYVYMPARRILSPAVAFMMTFIISGGIHDLATMAVRGSFAFLFTLWFFLLGVGAVLSRALEMDLAKRPFWVRATVNLAYLVVCLGLTLMLKKELEI